MLIFGVLIALPLWALILAGVSMVTQMLGFAGASVLLADFAAVSGLTAMAAVMASAAARRLARRRVAA